MSKQVKTIVITVVATLLVVGCAALLYLRAQPKGRRDNGVPLATFEIDDILTGHTIVDEQGTALDIGDIPGEKKLLFFAWDKCGDCKSEYGNYSLLFPAYDSDYLNLAFVWDNTIPHDDLAELGIPAGNSYSAQDQVKFTNWVPTYFAVDGDNTILFQEIEMALLVDYLRQNAVPNMDGLAAFIGEDKLVLGIDRCAGCKGTYDALAEAGEDFRYYLTGEYGSGAYDDVENVYMDPHGILAGALGVESFPAVVEVVNGEIVVDYP